MKKEETRRNSDQEKMKIEKEEERLGGRGQASNKDSSSLVGSSPDSRERGEIKR